MPFILRLVKNKYLIFLIFAFVFILLIYTIPLPENINPEWSRIVRFRDGSPMRVYTTSDEKWRIFIPLEKIDPLFVKTTIIYEDKYFYYHPGFNPFSLLRALIQNIKKRKIVSGGSTITMQLARILEPKERTVINKILEIFRAIQFELRLGKRKILELYLNIAPYGGNIEGIGAAMLFYYGRLPENMTPEEISFLVSLPQSPSTRFQKEKEKITGRNRVLKIMFDKGLITERDYIEGMKANIPELKKPPFNALHISDFLVLNYSQNDIKSTIDREIQRKIENIASSYKKRIRDMGATNLSVVVIENRTRKVRGVIGSLDYFDKENQGEVRGFYAYRSPGSTLKPFLYILAIEDGLINPLSLIEDAPYKFGDFEPVNFLKDFKGLVKAEEALSYSLNIPFILILRRYGYSRFVRKLMEAGLKGPLSYEKYGLPIITGGMDVRLIDLTNLYVTIAKGGMHGKYILIEDEDAEEKEIFNKGACFLALKALSKRDRPDAPNLKRYTAPSGRICWKTGTSFGRRDAWSIGFQKDFTVGVWVGNFSGEGSDSIIGAKLAAPIMFDIIKAIEEPFKGYFDWEYEAINEIDSVEVCAFSGYKRGNACSEKKLAPMLRNAHTYIECPFHKKFIIERKTGYRANPYKKYKEKEIVEKTFLVFPPPVQKILGGKGKPPEFPPDFKIVEKKEKLKIVSPLNNALYLIPKGIKGASKIPLMGFTSSKKDTIFWFLNGKFIGRTKSGEVLEIEPDEEEIVITGQDASGNTEVVRIQVIKE